MPPSSAPRATSKPAADPLWELYAFGGLSCAVAGTLTNSIDVAKTRWQLITKANVATTTPVGRPQLFPWIWSQLRSEGMIRFMSRGVTATWLRELSYSSIRMGLYEQLKRTIVDHRLHQQQQQQNGGAVAASAAVAAAAADVSFAERLACGIFSGLMGAAFSIPCDLARVRMQALIPATMAPPNPPLSVWGVWRDTIQAEGIAGLFRGGATTVVRAALLTGTQLATYDRAKHLVALHTGLAEGLSVCECLCCFRVHSL
jgi:hypothetical protein